MLLEREAASPGGMVTFKFITNKVVAGDDEHDLYDPQMQFYYGSGIKYSSHDWLHSTPDMTTLGQWSKPCCIE